MKLIYYSGRERCEIIKKLNFEESIFAKQSVRVLILIEQFISNAGSDSISNALRVKMEI